MGVDQGGLSGAVRAGTQIGELLRTQVAPPSQVGDDQGPSIQQLVSLFVAEAHGPATKLVEPLDRLDQVTKEGIAAHLAVADYVHAGADLQNNGFVNRLVLDRLELRGAAFSRRVAVASFL